MSGISKTPGERYYLELTAQPSDELRASLETFFIPNDDAPARLLGATALRSFHIAMFEVPARRDDQTFFEVGQGIALGHYINDLNKIRTNKFRIDSQASSSGIRKTDSGGADIWLTLKPSGSSERDAIVQPPLFDRDQAKAPDLGMYFTVEKDLFVGMAQARIALKGLTKLIRDEDTAIGRARADAQNDDFDDLNSFLPKAPKPVRRLYMTNLTINRSPREIDPPPSEETEIETHSVTKLAA